jgi:hypothetical protein
MKYSKDKYGRFVPAGFPEIKITAETVGKADLIMKNLANYYMNEMNKNNDNNLLKDRPFYIRFL